MSQRFAGKGLAGFIQKLYKLSALKEARKAVEGDTPRLLAKALRKVGTANDE